MAAPTRMGSLGAASRSGGREYPGSARRLTTYAGEIGDPDDACGRWADRLSDRQRFRAKIPVSRDTLFENRRILQPTTKRSTRIAICAYAIESVDLTVFPSGRNVLFAPRGAGHRKVAGPGGNPH